MIARAAGVGTLKNGGALPTWWENERRMTFCSGDGSRRVQRSAGSATEAGHVAMYYEVGLL